jgi:F-type H+-transporting ATPase subunit delta
LLQPQAGDADTVPSAYANALIELGQTKNVLEPIHADVDALAALFKENASLKEFIMNPVIADANKKQVFEQIGKEAGFNPFTLNFLNLLMEKGRLDMIVNIVDAFEKEYCLITDTQVSSCRPSCVLWHRHVTAGSPPYASPPRASHAVGPSCGVAERVIGKGL